MNKLNLLNILLLFCFIFLLSCSSKKSTQLFLNSNTDVELMEERDLQSHINLNFKINKDSLNQSFNSILDSLFINEMDISALGFNVEIRNLQNAELEIQGRQVLTKLPLQINLSKKTFITSIDIDARLEVTFITKIDVDSIWQIETQTTLEDYNWFKKPEMSLGSFNFGVKSLANIIIEKSKSNLENQIDTVMLAQFKLKDYVEHMMFFLRKPLLIDSTLSKWLNFSPDSILLSEVINSASFYSGNIEIQGSPLILNSKLQTNGKRNEKSLPELNWMDPEESNSKLKLSFDITLDKLTEYANKNFANKPISNDGREIKLSDILITKNNEELQCSANVKGDFFGKVLIKGTPKFDLKRQALITDDISIDFQTDNVLHKTGLWLMKGKINNKLSSMLNFSLKDKVEDIQSSINAQVENLSVQYDVDIKCDINQIEFKQFIITDEKINVFFELDLYLESTIYSLLNLQLAPK